MQPFSRPHNVSQPTSQPTNSWSLPRVQLCGLLRGQAAPAKKPRQLSCCHLTVRIRPFWGLHIAIQDCLTLKMNGYDLSKRRYLFDQTRGVTSRKTWLFSNRLCSLALHKQSSEIHCILHSLLFGIRELEISANQGHIPDPCWLGCKQDRQSAMTPQTRHTPTIPHGTHNNRK